MRTTVEIPDDLLEPVKSKDEREGCVFPDDNERLRQAWLDSAITFSPDDSEWSPEERKRYAEEWIADLQKLAEELAQMPKADPRTLREILEDDRNRLEPKDPSLYPLYEPRPRHVN